MQSSFDPEKIWDEFHVKTFPGSSRCYVMRLKPSSTPPSGDTLGHLPFLSNSAYVRHNDRLYYVNRLRKPPIEEIKISDENLKLFDLLVRPHDKAVPLTNDQLKAINEMIGHTPPPEEKRLEWYRQKITAQEKEIFSRKLASYKSTPSRLLNLLAIQKKWRERRKDNDLEE